MADSSGVTLNGYVNKSESFIQTEKISYEDSNGKKEIGGNDIRNNLSSYPAEINVNDDRNDGPDQVLPAENYIVTTPNGRVKIRANEESLKKWPPISVPSLLHKSATEFPDRIALVSKNENGTYTEITYKKYEEDVRTVAKAFIKLGLERYSSVCIIGFNSVEWFYSDLAAIFAGGFAAGMYTTNGPEACLHCLETSRANICVVEDNAQLQKILEVKDRAPHLKVIIQYTGKPTVPGVLSWEEVMNIGKSESDHKLDAVLKTIAVNECCTLVYTSGTEGKPKAVMLSHDNLTWNIQSVFEALNISNDVVEYMISYLPLCHVAAQLTDIYGIMVAGGRVTFADKDALKGTLKNTLVETRPTLFLGVPRVWEKFHEALLSVGQQSSGIKKIIASWAKLAALQHHEDAINGHPSESYKYRFYKWLVFDRIKQQLGFDRCKLFISAAAPISVDVKRYFMSLDILVMEAFGMSESAGPHLIGEPNHYRLTGIGKTIPGAETKLFDRGDQGGELCIRGRHVMMGYLNESEKTHDTVDEEGWLHSGDIGAIDEHEYLSITGRIKELIITAGGENVAPVPIEQIVKAEIPVLSQALLIGDKRKFLSILLTLKTVPDNEGKPTDVLLSDVKAWCKTILGEPCNTVTEILTNEEKKKKIYEELQKGIDRANVKAISRAQKIQKFALLPEDFSVGDELGPTLKVKRPVAYKKYEKLIDNIYKDS